MSVQISLASDSLLYYRQLEVGLKSAEMEVMLNTIL